MEEKNYFYADTIISNYMGGHCIFFYLSFPYGVISLYCNCECEQVEENRIYVHIHNIMCCLMGYVLFFLFV